MEHLRRNIYEDLVELGRDSLLEQYSQWTVVEDKDLDGAMKEDVRTRFVIWRDQHSISRDKPPFTLYESTSLRLPRFTYCLYVDEECMATLESHVTATLQKQQLNWGPPPPSLVVTIIDGDFGSTTDGISLGHGHNSNYPGWVYYSARYLAGFYDGAHHETLSQKDYTFPPRIGPAGIYNMGDL